jgi:hypothetical protein
MNFIKSLVTCQGARTGTGQSARSAIQPGRQLGLAASQATWGQPASQDSRSSQGAP